MSRFYVPCLRESDTYMRAVGYFTSSSLALAARGLPAFIAAGGRMRLVASPQLLATDLEAIRTGYEARASVVAKALLRAFDDASVSDIEREYLGFLAWLVAEERLDIKIATRVGLEQGIYHEKIGVFADAEGDAVAFTGSANETYGGFVNNFESIDVFLSWNDRQRVQRKIDAFESLWSNSTKGLDVTDLPEVAKDRLILLKPMSRPRTTATGEQPGEYRVAPPVARRLAPPAGLTPRRYQREAVASWIPSRRGILEMATGTGKTYTALLCAHQALAASSRSVVVIAAPFIHLVDQWADNCREFGVDPTSCFGSVSRWREGLRDELQALRLGLSEQVVVVTTHATLATRVFRDLISGIPDGVDVMLIGDEVHHLGTTAATAAVTALRADVTLGISATPQRWLDPSGDERMREAFGDVVFVYALSEAIRDGHLVPYRYWPILVDLTESEFRDYALLSRQIAQAMAIGDEDRLGALLRRRAEVLNGASGKIEALARLVPPGAPVDHALVYTTPSRPDDMTRLLAHHSRLRVHQFTYREGRSDRARLLRRFDEGVLQALVAIRCLDEGVDVPSTRTAFLTASSSNPREFIQRRGRILRRSPGKSEAAIYDLITVPPTSLARDGSTWASERSLLRRELARFIEFADASMNPNEARESLVDLQDKFELLDF